MYICLIRLALHVTPFCRTTAGHPPLLVSVAFWDPPRLSALCNACTSRRRTSPPSITSPPPLPHVNGPPLHTPRKRMEMYLKRIPLRFPGQDARETPRSKKAAAPLRLPQSICDGRSRATPKENPFPYFPFLSSSVPPLPKRPAAIATLRGDIRKRPPRN